MERGGDGVGTVKDEDGEGETERGGNGWWGDGERVRQRAGEVRRKASIRREGHGGRLRRREGKRREGGEGGVERKGTESERQIKGRRIGDAKRGEMHREGRRRQGR